MEFGLGLERNLVDRFNHNKERFILVPGSRSIPETVSFKKRPAVMDFGLELAPNVPQNQIGNGKLICCLQKIKTETFTESNFEFRHWP